jgi:hypothetical protein
VSNDENDKEDIQMYDINSALDALAPGRSLRIQTDDGTVLATFTKLDDGRVRLQGTGAAAVDLWPDGAVDLVSGRIKNPLGSA